MVDVVEKPKVIKKATRPRWRVWTLRIILAVLIASVIYHGYILFLVIRYKSANPQVTAIGESYRLDCPSEGLVRITEEPNCPSCI